MKSVILLVFVLFLLLFFCTGCRKNTVAPTSNGSSSSVSDIAGKRIWHGSYFGASSILIETFIVDDSNIVIKVDSNYISLIGHLPYFGAGNEHYITYNSVKKMFTYSGRSSVWASPSFEVSYP